MPNKPMSSMLEWVGSGTWETEKLLEDIADNVTCSVMAGYVVIGPVRIS